MTRFELVEGSLHIFENDILIMTTRGNPTKINQSFNSLEEAIEWYRTIVPAPQVEEVIAEEDIQNEENI